MKYLKIFLIVFIFLIITPISFASDNSTIDDIGSSVSSDSDFSTASNVYFDSSNPNEGNGSQENPFRDFSVSRVSNGDNVFFADGVYNLNANFNIQNLNIYGENLTIINGNGYHINLNNNLFASYVTFNSTYINVKGNLNLSHVNFENTSDINNNPAIISTSKKSNIYLDSCSFINNYGYFAGAIYIEADNNKLIIKNSYFDSNTAGLYGGAISCIGRITLNITNSSFRNNNPTRNAGGAIYSVNNTLSIQYSNFTSSKASFGGAICDLGSNTHITHVVVTDCEASYNGGAIYKMYGSIEIVSSNFISNVALNGGAIYADNSSLCNVKSSYFKSNYAFDYGGAIYTILNTRETVNANSYVSNHASTGNNYYAGESYNLFIGNGNYTRFINDFDFNGTIPSHYDLRDYGWVTPVKNQGNGGNCWAFSSLAALESCILKVSGTAYDLSEENMKNIEGYYSDYGWKLMTNLGGYDDMATAYLVSWLGAVNESQDAYNPYDFISPVLNSTVHVQNIIYLNRLNFTDNNAIKEAILKYGGVTTGMYFDNDYIRVFNYYYNGNSGDNHAVCIVGWDDNYSRNNFKNTPPGDGAWICKNSWGSNRFQKGYFYISYYDTGCAEVGEYDKSTYTFILNDTVGYDRNYQYDIAGITDYFITGKDTIWYENIFNATSNELLVAFSTYFNTTTEWQAQIYVNGDLKLTQTGSAVSGYFTINLDEAIPLVKNDVFKIVLRIHCEKYASFPISEKVRTNRQLYRPGVSYFSYDGVDWIDLCDYSLNMTQYHHIYNSQVACIKAFTSNTLDTKIELVNAGLVAYGASCDLIAKVTDEYGCLASTGKVMFYYDGGYHLANVKGGYAIIPNTTLSLGKHLVNVSYIGNDYYYASNSSAVYEVSNLSYKLTLDIPDIYYGDDLIIINTVIDTNSTKLSGTVSVEIGPGQGYVEANTESSVSNTLAPGNYTATGNYVDSTYTTSFIIKKLLLNLSLDIVKNDVDSVNITLQFSRAINDNVTVDVNSKKHTVKVSNGLGILRLDDLDYGNYTVSVNYSGEFYENCSASGSFSIDNVKTSLKSDGVVMYYHDGTRFMVLLHDKNGKGISNESVIIVINGVSYTRTTNSSGYASMAINLNKGSYKVFVNYTGNGKYLPSDLTTNVLVKTTITAEDVTKYYKNATQFYARVYDYQGNYIKNTDVSMNINGVFYTRTTNENGLVRLNINLSPGTYILTTTNPITGEQLSNNVTILSRLVDNYDLVKYYKNASKYTVKVLSPKGEALANVSVNFNINGVLYSRLTDSNGVASLAINLSPGTYIITAEYDGGMVSNTITVLPIIVAEDLEMNYRDGSKFKATLLDSHGKPYPSQIIQFNINGVLYSRLTNQTGVATLNINLGAGIYIITSSFNGFYTSNTITIH